MYAVFQSGGKQHRVSEGQVVRLEKLELATGATVEFDSVLMVVNGEDVKIGEDALFCAMAYQRAEKAAFLNEYLYNYRKVSSSADRRFRPDIEETFENLLKYTYEFLEQDTSLSGKDTCYTGLVYDCMARALEKKFVHRENPAGYRERILQIRRFADNPWVRAGITQKFDRSIFKKKQQAVLFCMKFRLYQGLYLLQKMKEQKKN